jgi:hypothetical protein
VTLVIRRITIAILAAFLAGAVLAVPASSKGGPGAVAAKKAKKCKKKKSKKSAVTAKKKKKCKKGGGGTSGSGLPGQATPSSPKQPDQPVTPPTLQVTELGVAANPVFAGNSTTGQVTVDTVAGPSGQQVDLQSSDPSVSVPANVVVGAGQKTASFSVSTTAGTPATATLTASIGSSNATAQLDVVDTASVSSVKLERECFTIGLFSSNRVSLDVPAPSDTPVDLVSSDPLSLQVQPGVTVPTGSSSALFSVTTLLPISSAVVTASLGSSEATDTASVSATTPDPKASGLTLSPESVLAGDLTTGTVSLDCEAPAGGTVVSLSAVGPGASELPPTLTMPSSVTVPAGATSATFQIQTIEGGDGTESGTYTISATAGGDTKDTTLTVNNQAT